MIVQKSVVGAAKDAALSAIREGTSRETVARGIAAGVALVAAMAVGVAAAMTAMTRVEVEKEVGAVAATIVTAVDGSTITEGAAEAVA